MSPQREVDDLKARLIQARAETTAAETALAIERRMSQLATDARIVELQHASALKQRQLTAQVEKLSLEGAQVRMIVSPLQAVEKEKHEYEHSQTDMLEPKFSS